MITYRYSLSQWPTHMLTVAKHKINSNVSYILDSKFERCSFSSAYFFCRLFFLNSWLLFHIQCHSQSTNKCICDAIYGIRIHSFSFWCCCCFVFEFSFILYCCFVIAKIESKTFARSHHSFVRLFRFPLFCILILLSNVNFIWWYISSLLLCSLFLVYKLTISEPMQLYEFSWKRTFIIVANRMLTETTCILICNETIKFRLKKLTRNKWFLFWLYR